MSFTLHIPGRRACLALFVLAGLLAPAAQTRGAATAVLSDNKKQRLQEHSIRIRRLQEGIIDQKIKVFDSRKKERNLLAELEAIDRNLQNRRQRLAELRRQFRRQEELLAGQRHNLDSRERELTAYKEHIKERLAAYYRLGTIGLLNVVFSAETLPELLDSQEYFQNLFRHDRQAVNTYRTSIKALQEARTEHTEEQRRLAALMKAVAREEQLLAESIREKKNLLARVKNEKNLHQQAVAEIEAAAAELTATLKTLQERLPASPPPETTQVENQPSAASNDTFANSKGKLRPPIAGALITAPGDADRPGPDAYAGGIDIIAEEGEEIRAVFAGRVIHSGYMRGYGNLLIIDHGDRYYSLISRTGTLLKEQGETVAGGEVIALAGEDESLLGEGIRFEIRHGSTPENPLQWLDPAGLNFKKPNP